MSTKKSGLGRGLSALLENVETDVTSKGDISGSPTIVGAVANISLDKIEANPFQPRTDFEAEALQELAQSIKEQGIIQPVTVRKLGYDKYQLISGERRFKASKMAGLEFIPAYIRIANDRAMLEMALVENIQRENLNPIEISLSYKRLIEECTLTQEELSDKVGKKRSTVANYLRLLKLPAEIQAGIRDNKITMGHARAIINIDDAEVQLKIYKDILSNVLSVRRVEELARGTSAAPNKKKSPKIFLSSELKKIQDELSDQFEARILIQKIDKNGKGKIMIPFSSEDDLKRILDMLNF
jgi:ParB family transcriptional regulator, chromosome partitioning protein